MIFFGSFYYLFIYFCSIDSNFVSSSMPKDIKSHYTLLCQNPLDLVFYLYWQWVNSTGGLIPGCPEWNWAQQEGIRLQWCLLFISRWELFLFSLFSKHISLLGLQLQGAHMKRKRMIRMETLLYVSCFSFFMCVCIFYLVRNEKAFYGLNTQHDYICSLPKCIVVVFFLTYPKIFNSQKTYFCYLAL